MLRDHIAVCNTSGRTSLARRDFVDGVKSVAGVLSLLPVLTNPIEQSAGLLKGKKSLMQALLRERAKERARDQKC